MTSVHEHLRRLGVGNRLKGYKMVMMAVLLAAEDEERLQCVRERILEPVARHFDCDFRCAERNIRTVIAAAWRCSPEYLTYLAGFPLTSRPSVSEFLDILSSFIQRERQKTFQA